MTRTLLALVLGVLLGVGATLLLFRPAPPGCLLGHPAGRPRSRLLIRFERPRHAKRAATSTRRSPQPMRRSLRR
jgi:hypothetical protein